MRFRAFLAVAAFAAAPIVAVPAHAAPVILAVGPLQPDGGFSHYKMSLISDACGFPDFDSPTATTNLLFKIDPDTREAYFQITNHCGVFDEAFEPGECELSNQIWYCEHDRPDGFSAWAALGTIDGRPHITATEYLPSPPGQRMIHWSVNGFVLMVVSA